MNTLEAILTIETDEGASEDEQIAAWQHLIDTGVVWTLQGWYGRGAVNLINAGFCTSAQETQV